LKIDNGDLLNQAFLDLIQREKSFVLSGHEHPDGDCLGSQVGLFHLLRELGAEVSIFNPDPVAPSLSFLEDHTPIANRREQVTPPVADVLILLDCARLTRLGRLGEAFREQQPAIAVIDHHVGSENGDGDVCYVDVSAAATGVLVYNLYQQLGVKISAPAAEAIFVSIVSDTGWFRYSNTDPKTLRIAAEMVEAGAQPDRLYDRMFRDNDPESVTLLAESLSRHEMLLDGRLGYSVLEPACMARANKAGFDTDQILEVIRSVKGVEVAGLFKSLNSGLTKVSLRSMGALDVQVIAAALGGGGHAKAAGATVKRPVVEVVATVESLVRSALLEFGEQGPSGGS
jgi:phosphoesterase RecJ-like protein